MNELQKMEFDLLKCFDSVCKDLGISYFLVCGSALGAVKYGGFIPWDDDVDVGLFREDYNKFLSEAPKYLPKHIFLQSFNSDENYPNIFAKLRNSNTTYIEKAVSNIKMNHGIYIDIFPLDGYPVCEKEGIKLERAKKMYKKILSCAYTKDRSFFNNIAVIILRFLRVHKNTKKYLKQYDKLISSYSIEDSKLICNHGNWQGILEYSPRDHYGDGEWVMFENLKVRVPQKYDLYLTQKYGNWRDDLPEDKKIGHHYYQILDCNKSYLNYVSYDE